MTGNERFSLWIKACRECHTMVYPLEGSGDHGLYKTWNEYEYRNSYFRTAPIYRVWIHGMDAYCGLDIRLAYSVWEHNKNSAIQEGKNGQISYRYR